MPIDPAIAIGADLGEKPISWTVKDVLTYHLGIGAGGEPFDPRELRYTYEKNLWVIPTFATVAPDLDRTEPPKIVFPGIDIALVNVVHGRQDLTVHAPIPIEGTAVARSRIIDVYDRGTSALILRETTVTNDRGQQLWTDVMSIFARNEGGFGGHRGTIERIAPPERAPDLVVDTPTLPQQALIFRLSGDWNPLHCDPAFARAAGFDHPILVGLGTYGIVAKAVIDAVFDSNPHRMASWSVRFAQPLFPGETVRTRIWNDGRRFVVTAESVERSVPLLTEATMTAR